MSFQIICECSQDCWIVVCLPQGGIAATTEQTPNFACVMIVVNVQILVAIVALANGAHSTLKAEHSIVLFGSQTILLFTVFFLLGAWLWIVSFVCPDGCKFRFAAVAQFAVVMEL